MPKLLTEKKRDFEIDANEAEIEMAIAEWETAKPLEIPPKRKEDKPTPQSSPQPINALICLMFKVRPTASRIAETMDKYAPPPKFGKLQSYFDDHLKKQTEHKPNVK